MIDWGSWTLLIKRQHAEKNRNSKIRYQLQNKREKLLNNSKKQLEFPKISNDKMEILKAKIKKDQKYQKIKSIIINVILTAWSVL